MKARMLAIVAAMLLTAALSAGCDLFTVAGVLASPVVYDVYAPVPVPVVYDPCFYGCGDYVEVWYKQR
jgi:hypothetical protein